MAADENDLETIEVLSTQYQPTPSVNGYYRPVPNYNENVPQIRSVDDYEKEPPSFYFRPPTGSSTLSSNNHRAGGRKSTPHSTKDPTLISLPLRDGDSDGSQTVKEPLTADEKKRKRITFAVGVIAGLIIISSVLLVAITLNMTSKIDAIVKEQNDKVYDQLTSSKGNYGDVWKNSTLHDSQSFPVLQYANRANP